MEKLSIPIILGTNREGRKSELVAQFLLQQLQQRDTVTTQLVDVREYHVPADNYGTALKDSFSQYRDIVVAADGFIIVVPEYNHGYPGTLKALLDVLLKEYNHKAVGLAGVSSGSFGGARVIENLLPVVRELGMVAIARDLNFGSVGSVFDEAGELQDEKFIERSEKFFDELIWMSQALKSARDQG